jgi:hypothetical protein
VNKFKLKIKNVTADVLAQLIPSGVKGLTPQNIRNNNAAVTLSQVLYLSYYHHF